MGYKVKLLPVVHADLRKVKKWCHEKSQTLGQEFKAEVEKDVDYISEYPDHYQLKYKELRQAL